MLYRPQIEKDELDLMVELLEAESQQLGPEIHHTDSRNVRDQLRQRHERADHLLAKLRSLQPEGDAGHRLPA